MSLSQMLLPEFDHEMTTTRKLLERVPEDRQDWQPHTKSMTLARLASHVAELPGWGVMTLTQDSLDLAPPGGGGYQPKIHASRQEMLDAFDAHVRETRAQIEKTDDAAYAKPWSLLNGGQVIFTQPRFSVLRGFLMNHIIHHRGQLSVYLRLNDVSVPAMYGPSADEQF